MAKWGVPSCISKVGLLAISASYASMALAQSYSIPAPPTRSPVDANNVNLATGQLSFSETDLSIGPQGAGGLAHTRVRSEAASGGGWRHQYLMAVTRTGTGVSLQLGDHSAAYNGTFSGSTGSFTSAQGDGSTVTFSGNIYTYTGPDGTVMTFDRSIVANSASYYGPVDAVATSITRPSGEVLTLSYKQDYYDYFVNGDTIAVYVARLQDVSSTAGYSLHYSYSSDDSDDTDNWYQISAVQALNTTTGTGAIVSYSYDTTSSPGNTLETVTDPQSFTRRYTFDGTRHMIALKRGSSSSDNYLVAHDGNGIVLTFSNGFSNWTYSWSVSGTTRTGTISEPLGRTRTVTADTTFDNILTDQDEVGRTTTYAYNSFGQPTSVTAPEGNYVTYAYDGRGNQTSRTSVAKAGSGLANIVESASFDSSCLNLKTCNQPNTTTDARGNVTSYTYDATHGGVTSVTLPAPSSGAVQPQTRYSYSALYAYYKNSGGSIVAAPSPIYKLTGTSACRTTASCIGTADETKLTYVYGTPGVANNLLLTSVTTGAGDGSVSATTTMTYGVIGNLKSVDGPLPGSGDTTNYTYNSDRQVTQVTYPDPDGGGPALSRSIKYGYSADAQLNVTLVGTANADGSGFATAQQILTTYDAIGRKIQGSVVAGSTYAVTQFSYDAAGRLDCTAQRMDPTTFGSLPSSACSLAGSGGAYGPDRIAKYGYDAADEQISVTTAYGVSGQQRTLATNTYSANGRLKTLADAKNNLTTYNYDGFDRLSQTLFPSPSTPGTSNSADYEQLGYDAGSNVVSKRLRNGTSIGYTYDMLNRLTAKALPSGTTNANPSFAYDNFNELTQANNAGSLYSSTTSYGYDALGRAVSETMGLNGTNLTTASQYDAAGRRTRLTWNDGFYVTYAYDNASQLTGILESGTTPLVSIAYDNQGRRTVLCRNNNASMCTAYGYDAVSRLTGLTLTPSGTGTTITLGGYSPAGQLGNRTNSNDAFAWTGGVNTNRGYAANGLNQYTQTGTIVPTYDPKGNLTSAGTPTYAFNAESELATLTLGGSTHRYYTDALHRLIFNNGDTMRFEYDGSSLAAEYSTSGTLQRRYVFGPGDDEPLVWYEGSGTGDKRFLVADERGSIIQVQNASGGTIATNSYDEYGIPASTNQGRFQYTGQQWIPDIGMYYYKARFYSPTLGRFLQTDPIGYAAGPNIYNYVNSDPVNATDPSGLCTGSLISQSDGQCIGGGYIDGSGSVLNVNPPGAAVKPHATAGGTSTGSTQQGQGALDGGTQGGGSAGSAGDIVVRGLRSTYQDLQQNGDNTPQPGDVVVTGKRHPGVQLAQEIIDPFPFFEEPPIIEEPQVPYPIDPARPPGPGWQYRGPPGKGSWYNPKTGESLRPDLQHPEPLGPHWDYRGPSGDWYRWFNDGRGMVPKIPRVI